MFITLYVEDLDSLSDVAKQILEHTSLRKKFAFYGEMGVGKTTLIKALSLHLGVKDIVSSPTFSIVNEYLTQSSDKVYHFDFYRIENEEEAFDIGYQEYFLSSNYCFIEWPDKIPNLIEDNMVRIHISLDGNKRVIKLII